ncbi:DEAD box ATP-dependent RNA helicase family member protein [Theileria equi strain WA]|uniref:RNA helicase n=1 Tax=Theileria equi strain WA TaxID=1537102 RepID=L1LBU7_THEEQ|nr:DEAD box ATP-dependent RNA helicase family member protein [Theileria equi strain WA]EKX72653.1 DEAD box ATP-dependent RNA helicase family member protein [Theileria equi strain WA]|eukprot:XP_004832105.1 DEAD box ATP-dependent RNA helicase family member protein [Theileria equi strain WA]
MGALERSSSSHRRDSPRRSHRKRSRSSHRHHRKYSSDRKDRSRSHNRDRRRHDRHKRRHRDSSRSSSRESPPSKQNDRNDKHEVKENASEKPKGDSVVDVKSSVDTTKLDRLSRFKKLAESRKKMVSENNNAISMKITSSDKAKPETSVLPVFQASNESSSNIQQMTDSLDDGIDPLDRYMLKLEEENKYELQESFNQILPIEETEEQVDPSKVVTLEDIMAWSNDDKVKDENIDEEDFVSRLKEKSIVDVNDTVASDDERYFSDNDPDVEEHNNPNSYSDLLGKIKTKRELPRVDHSKIDYLPFNKNFYVQVSAITAMKEHEVDAFRKTNGNIRIRGKQCPRPIYSFSQCGLPDPILSLLQKREYEKPFPIQMQCIPALMCGRDVIGIAETGSGKTLAFLLPAIRHVLDQPKLREMDGMIVLIISPTRELTIQISKECSKLCKTVDLRVVAVYGGAGIGKQLNSLKRGAEIVCGTPGRLIDVLTTSKGKVTNLRRVTFLVLDEADRMFDMGFSPQITAIIDNIRPDRQTALFSATFPPVIENLAKKILTKPLQIIVGERGKSASQVDQHVVILPEGRKIYYLLKLLGEWHEHGSIIIFVNRQLDADNLFAELLKYGYECAVLHGGQDQTDREFTLQDFREGKKGILISTSIAARGIDVKSVVLVINYAAPDHFEDYVHRVGRTGRAGNFGTSYTFLAPEEASKSHDIIRALKLANQDVPEELTQLAQAHLATVDSKQRFKGGFGGKGFKFTDAERSRQQQERRNACKELGFGNDEDEDEPDSTPMIANAIAQSAKTALQSAKEVAKQYEKSYLNQPTPMIKGLSCAGYIDASTGNTIDEFNINSFPESVRSKITNKEVLARVSENTNVTLQVKGFYNPMDPATRNLAMLGGTKGLYIEIIGPSVISVQRAVNELKMIIQEITVGQPGQPPLPKPIGRYTVI